MKANDFVVETTLVGVAMNGLSHLVGVASKAQFACALVRGLGGNLSPQTVEKFAKEVFHWTHETPPDQRKPLDTYFDLETSRLCTYQLQLPDNLSVSDLVDGGGGSLPVVQTPGVQRGLDMFSPWLQSDNRQPFLVVGPEGCGKE